MAAPVPTSTTPKEAEEPTDVITNDILLLKTFDKGDVIVPATDGLPNNHSSDQRSTWRTWFRRGHHPEVVQEFRKTADQHSNHYVSVSLTPPEEHLRINSDGTGRNKSSRFCPRRQSKWRPREKWLMLFLMLVTVACLAFVVISLISFFRQGQGK